MSKTSCVGPGAGCAELERHAEGRRGLLPEDLQHLLRAERPRAARPGQLLALPETERPMAAGGDRRQLGPDLRREVALRQQPVAFPDEEVTGVERRRHAVRGVQRGLAVAARVAVLDVVVDQRGLVEALHGHGHLAQRVGRRGVRVVLQRLVHADGEERPPALAGAGQLAHGPASRSRPAARSAEQLVERRGGEPALDVLAAARRDRAGGSDRRSLRG